MDMAKLPGQREFHFFDIIDTFIRKFSRRRRYRYQLEAFVDKVKGREPRNWVDAQDTVTNMRWLEKIYEKVCSAPSSHS